MLLLLEQPMETQPILTASLQPDRRRRDSPKGLTFRDATEVFFREYQIITQGERNAEYVAQKSDQIRVHLFPFFGDKALTAVTAGRVQEYRVHRQTSRINPKTGKPKTPARAMLHGEMVTLRQVLKTANRKGWIDALPDMSAP